MFAGHSLDTLTAWFRKKRTAIFLTMGGMLIMGLLIALTECGGG